MAEQILLSLAMIAVAIVIGSIASIKLKFPPVVMLILIGVLLGPHAVGIVQGDATTDFFAEIGGILLLFLIGTEFNFAKIMKLGLKSIIVAGIELGLLFFLVYYITILLGFSPMAAVFLALAISVTSTALTVKMLQDLSLSHREETSLLVGVSVIEDIIAVLVLGIISSLAIGVDLSAENVIVSVMKSITILCAAYFVLSRAIKYFLRTHNITEDNMVLLALGLAMGLSFLATYIGLSPAIGAFVAGNIVASLPQAKEFTRSIHRFGLFFISLFFLSIGLLVNPADIVTGSYFIALLIGLAVIGKLVGVGLGTYFAGYSGESAVFAGIAMIPIGEMSLLIVKAGVDLGVLDPTILGATAILVLVTSLLSYPAILHNRKIYMFLDAIIPKSLKQIGKRITANLSYLTYQLSVRGSLFKRITNNMDKISVALIGVLAIVSVFFVLPKYVSDPVVLLLILVAVAVSMILLLFRNRVPRWASGARYSGYRYKRR